MRNGSFGMWADWNWVLAGLLFAGCNSSDSGSSNVGRDAGDEPSSEASDGSAGNSEPTDEARTSLDAGAGASNESDAGQNDSAGDASAAPSTEPERTNGADAKAPVADAGTTSESEGDSGTVESPFIPEGALLYVYHQTPDHDLLIARDLESGDEVIVTDLTGDGSFGWNIEGFALSPDRRRIALASLYDPTAEDVATGLATRAIWTMATNGTDFRRLTPTFPNDAQGRQGFQYEVDNPEWSADGSRVLYNFGTYWWGGTDLEGGTSPWIVEANGESLPTTFTTAAPCTVIHPARNPVTGDFLFIHSVCVPGQGNGDGLYLYPAEGSTTPQQLVASMHVDGSVDVLLRKAAWLPDGSGFLFMGGTLDTDWRAGLLIYDMQEGSVSSLVSPTANASIYGVTMSADASKIVYCTRDDDGNEDLRLIDLSLASATDTAITNDGKSCDPSF